MGIKDLWSILTPFCERKPLYELQGKTVAVDLSCWICEAQNIAEYQIQPRMYLRNLYFRTCYLLLMEVIPVFVLEGKAPTLKYQTIADRNAIQFKGSKPKSDKVKTGKDRSRFHFVLKQCEEMLKYMGLICITGTGEAESMCAYLNADGLVAGCISQDSDCFAYGAQIVYRNFSISQQGSYAASGGAVDIYDIKKAEKALNFGRNKIIALALLCGSDYNEGVHGVGKDSALKFMNRYSNDEILDRMRSWRNKTSLYSELEMKINNKNICTSCGHFGKIQQHVKNGCSDCKTTKGCDFTRYREERIEIKNELQIRNKALQDPNFPNESLINEYLIKKDNIKQLDLKWRQPNLINFVKFTNKFLGWEEIYAFEKLLPILTRWQLLNHKFVADKVKRNSISEIKGVIYPKCIKKTRNPKGMPSYEIIWEDRQNCFDSLIPEEQLETYKENRKDDLESLYSTIEPKHLVEAAYPSLVQEFLETKNKKAKKPTKRSKNIENITEQLLNTSISEPKPKKTRKKTEKPENLQTIETFFPKTKVAQLIKQSKLECSFDLDCSRFGDEDDEWDESLIIDEIVSQSPKLPDTIKNLGFKYVESNKTPGTSDEENCEIEEEILSGNCSLTYNQNNSLINNKLNQSSFFEYNLNDEMDLFEKTFEKKLDNNSSSEDTNDLDTNNSKDAKNDSNTSFEFDQPYIPLFERIKKNTSK